MASGTPGMPNSFLRFERLLVVVEIMNGPTRQVVSKSRYRTYIYHVTIDFGHVISTRSSKG